MVAPAIAAGRPSKLSPIINESVRRQNGYEYVCGPSLISNLRPVRGLSDRAMANVFASGVAKSTYANLTNAIQKFVRRWSSMNVPAIFRL